MLRPEQMSKISVTGSKSVMDEVIETMHDLHLVHITDYDGSWEGFEPGDSLEGADETSSKLVTVRALESILDLDDADEAGPTETVDLSNADERLEEVRQEVNELDDRRESHRTRLREIDDRLEQMELFADLGIDLDLLWGYDSLDVLVGEGDPAAVAEALAAADEVDAFEVFSGTDGDSVAAFGSMEGDQRIDDALVGVSVTAYDVPEVGGDPASNVEELEQERRAVEAELEKVETELETVRVNEGPFLLALEEELTIRAEKTEAPLRFATTERSFVVEGWVPSSQYDQLTATLESEIGDRIELSELERTRYTGHEGPHEQTADAEQHHETATDGGSATEGGTDAAGREDATAGGDEAADAEVATDGGHADADVVTVDDDPPVIQNNSGIVNPFELLTKAVNRPKYSEFDPTAVLFLTLPLFFGFMIGDIGYGLVYVLIGYAVYRRFDAESLSNFGAVMAWLGLATIVFGVLYGEVFGLHFLEWFDLHPVLEKGITEEEWAITWLLAAVVAGWFHLNVGYIFEFVEEFQLHGAKPAVVEVGSWLLMLNGLWIWIFSYDFQATGLVGYLTFPGSKPEFLVGSEALFAQGPLGFGFEGFPAIVGVLGLVAFVLGIAILLSGPWYEVFEFLVPLAHVLSYTRLTAVLLSKAGMALAANLLYFGAYEDAEGFHFIHAKATDSKKIEESEIIFGGLFNMGSEVTVGSITFGIEGALLGLPVLLLAHVVVLAIGGTAAIQAIRLEYFEFFEKFYEGGGKNYEPFGHERTRTTDT
jgi:V/A-type H+-transporting ATPase subunit I